MKSLFLACKTAKNVSKKFSFFLFLVGTYKKLCYFSTDFSKIYLAKSFLITPCGKLVAIFPFTLRNRNYVIFGRLFWKSTGCGAKSLGAEALGDQGLRRPNMTFWWCHTENFIYGVVHAKKSTGLHTRPPLPVMENVATNLPHGVCQKSPKINFG